MREEDIDIVEMIIERMPEQTKEQYEINQYIVLILFLLV